MSSTLGYVRHYYGVPAHRGYRVKFQGQPGRILSSTHARLNVLLDTGERVHIHPTWEVEYLGAPVAASVLGSGETE